MATYPTIAPTNLTSLGDTYLLMQENINYLQTREVLSAALDQAEWVSVFNYKVNDTTRGSNGRKYIAVQPSGPSSGGAKDPTTSPSFWVDYTDFIQLRKATEQEAIDGSAVNAYMTPDLTKTAIGESVPDKATTPEAEAGVNDENYMTPLKTKQAVDALSISNSNFVGSIGIFLTASVPTGRWIKANGATLSRTTYSELFSVIGTTFGAGDGSTTFQIPDLRGEFLRFWDDGRGVDKETNGPSRTFGSYQSTQTGIHNHTESARWDGADGSSAYQDGFRNVTAVTEGVNVRVIGTPSDTLTVTAGNPWLRTATDNNPRPSIGDEDYENDGESRPRNIALAAYIRY